MIRFACLFLLLAAPVSAEPIVIDRVLAEVNAEVILQSELGPRMLIYQQQLASIANRKDRERRRQKLARSLLDELIEEELMAQAAREVDIQIPKSDIDAELELTKKRFGLDDEGLEQALAAQGFTLSSYREVLRKKQLHQQAINFYVRSKVSVSDEDIKARYQDLQRRSGDIDKLRLYQIVVAVNADAEDETVAKAKARADDIAARIRDGASFEEIAKAESDDEGSAKGGGDLGWIEKGSMQPQLEAVVFSLAKGDISNPIRSGQGFHIFLAKEHKQAEIPAMSEMRQQLENEIYREVMDRELREWIKKLRAKAHIEVKV